ncbi:MAG: hypothetical protein ACLQVI_00505 [Polyangiaceae bacterium]|jgi:hypothetical protein
MLRRLFVGLLIGAIVGGLVAAGVIAGLGMLKLTGIFAYVFAAATGTLTGLVAGKPIWASGGQIEAGLKAFFGALLAAGGMYAIRAWLHFDVDLSIAHAGSGHLSELPGAFLPIIGAVLGGFYELDNTPEAKDGGASKSGKGGPRVAASVRVAEEAEAEEEPAASAAAKKRSR